MNSIIDIDLTLLNPLQFEQLCCDLVEASGFSSVVSLEGSADGGRDILASRGISNGIVDDYVEQWFFECKHRKAGVSQKLISDKFTNAISRELDHLVFLVSTHLTKDAREWVERMRASAKFKIHVTDGRAIKRLLKAHPKIAEKYFNTEMQVARRAWILSEARPNHDALIRMSEPKSLASCGSFDLALLFYWSQRSASQGNQNDTFLWRNWFPLLVPLANTTSPLLEEAQLEDGKFEDSAFHEEHGVVMTARFIKTATLGHTTGIYAVQMIDDQLIEVLIEHNDKMQVGIRHLTQGAEREYERVYRFTIPSYLRRKRLAPSVRFS